MPYLTGERLIKSHRFIAGHTGAATGECRIGVRSTKLEQEARERQKDSWASTHLTRLGRTSRGGSNGTAQAYCRLRLLNYKGATNGPHQLSTLNSQALHGLFGRRQICRNGTGGTGAAHQQPTG